MIGTETCSKLFCEYFERKIHSEQADLPASSWVNHHHAGKANHFLTSPIYLLFIATHRIFLSPPPPWCLCYTQTGHSVTKKDSFAFFHLSLPFPTLSVCTIEAFPLSEFPHFWQGCSAGVIWSVTVTRVIWCAMDVGANTVPLLSSGKCVCQKQQQNWGDSTFPVGSHRAQSKKKNPKSQFDGWVPRWSNPVRKVMTCNSLWHFRWLEKKKTKLKYLNCKLLYYLIGCISSFSVLSQKTKQNKKLWKPNLKKASSFPSGSPTQPLSDLKLEQGSIIQSKGKVSATPETIKSCTKY